MNFLKKLIILLAVLFVAVLVTGLVLPKEVAVVRSRLIDAPADAIFPHVNSFENWPAWDPWTEADPTIKYTYSGRKTGKGAIQSWTSENTSNGRMEITHSIPSQQIGMDMSFNDGQYTAKGVFRFTPEADGVRVIWIDVMYMGSNPLARWMGQFMNGTVGPQFERGLLNLKQLVESEEAERAERAKGRSGAE